MQAQALRAIPPLIQLQAPHWGLRPWVVVWHQAQPLLPWWHQQCSKIQKVAINDPCICYILYECTLIVDAQDNVPQDGFREGVFPSWNLILIVLYSWDNFRLTVW